jgi:hypothetical protein
MIAAWLTYLYKALLYLYPPGFRAEFAEEMQDVFSQAIKDASLKGAFSLAYLCLNELLSLPVSLMRTHRSGHLGRGTISALPMQKNSSFDQSWQELVLALAVFLLPAGAILINQTSPPPTSLLSALLFLGVMVFIGWMGGFPLWSIGNIGIVLVIAAYLVLFQWVTGLVAPALITNFSPGPLDRSTYLLLEIASRGMLWLILLCLTLLVVALLAVFNRFQPLLRGVRHDWTLLSYILYGEAVFALLLLFQTQRFTLNYAIASLMCLLAGVWFFLRSPARWQRLLALVACLTLAVGIAVLGQWPIHPDGGWLSWSELNPSDAGRLLLSWVWMVVALLLPGLLARLPSKTGQKGLAG